MLRSLFIGLSQSATFRKIALGFPLTRRVSRRFVAGERLEEAIAAIQRLNQAVGRYAATPYPTIDDSRSPWTNSRGVRPGSQ